MLFKKLYSLDVDDLFHLDFSSLEVFDSFFLLLSTAKNDLFLHDSSEIVVSRISIELDRAEVVKISSKNLVLLCKS